jgi:hypothetical protein
MGSADIYDPARVPHAQLGDRRSAIIPDVESGEATRAPGPGGEHRCKALCASEYLKRTAAAQ